MDREQLEALLRRMSTVEQVSDSRDSVSWRAHREAEALDDPALLPVLEEIIAAHPKKKERHLRDDAHFVYGKILKNTFRREGCAYLMQRLTAETDPYILYPILDLLRDLPIPPDLDISPMIRCAQHEKWLVRYSAIRALGACPSEESRAVLRGFLAQEDEKTYRQEIIYANAALGLIGTAADIPLMEKHLHTRIRDMKLSAQIAIARIQGRTEP